MEDGDILRKRKEEERMKTELRECLGIPKDESENQTSRLDLS
jgi:hypothetical protein